MLQPIEYTPPVHIKLDILYQDNNLIALNKPAGLLSVPGRGEDKQDCMLSRLQIEFPEALVIHRLDMPTSGIIMFARNKET
ncbi:MAG: pseudouridine synthase, partial [Gammaproteobacteria bacterium]|nr:pseudouridine synthase [Gammaproteobacteria bacterium]